MLYPLLRKRQQNNNHYEVKLLNKPTKILFSNVQSHLNVVVANEVDELVS